MLECGIDPGYVLDKMMPFEIEALLENRWMKNKESWEQTRYASYVNAQMNTKKELEPTDILKFYWEKEPEKQVDTKEDKEKLWKEMKDMEMKMNNK